jgi:hypothetical protein
MLTPFGGRRTKVQSSNVLLESKCDPNLAFCPPSYLALMLSIGGLDLEMERTRNAEGAGHFENCAIASDGPHDAIENAGPFAMDNFGAQPHASWCVNRLVLAIHFPSPKCNEKVKEVLTHITTPYQDHQPTSLTRELLRGFIGV